MNWILNLFRKKKSTISNENHILKTEEWFKIVKNNIFKKDIYDKRKIQFRVFIEEVIELLQSVTSKKEFYSSLKDEFAYQTYIYLENAIIALEKLKYFITHNKEDFVIKIDDREKFIDSLCDVYVTIIGLMVFYDVDVEKAVKEVNKSNFSKFINGKPVFDNTGKIKKSSYYKKPNFKNL